MRKRQAKKNDGGQQRLWLKLLRRINFDRLIDKLEARREYVTKCQ
jgi:hypothetical protein